jgi:hypothetical protein
LEPILLKSFITRTVFFIPALIFAFASLKIQKFRYPLFLLYFPFFFLASFIHSIMVFFIENQSSKLPPNTRYYSDIILTCIQELSFFMTKSFLIPVGIIEMLSCIGMLCYFIILLLNKNKQNLISSNNWFSTSSTLMIFTQP